MDETQHSLLPWVTWHTSRPFRDAMDTGVPAAAAAAPILLNICLITALIYGVTLGEGVEARRETAQWMALAVSLSGFLQVAWLGAFMRKAGFRLSLVAPKLTSGVKELFVLALPAVFGAGVATSAAYNTIKVMEI